MICIKSVLRVVCAVMLSVMAAALIGCATYYVSSAYCQDWTPEPFIEPVEGHSGFHLGLVGNASYLDMSPGDFHTGAKAGLTLGTSGAFTEAFGWSASATVTGFLYDAQRFDPGYFSYGGNAELGTMLVVGSSPFWFSAGPEAVYSLELGPYVDMRRQFVPASPVDDYFFGWGAYDSYPEVNLSPSGNTMSILGTMRFTFDLQEKRYISFGSSFGFFDPDFPNNLFVETGHLQYVFFMFIDIQGKLLRVYGSMEYGVGEVGGYGFSLGTEVILAR